jgi:histidinol dehydrogenase
MKRQYDNIVLTELPDKARVILRQMKRDTKDFTDMAAMRVIRPKFNQIIQTIKTKYPKAILATRGKLTDKFREAGFLLRTKQLSSAARTLKQADTASNRTINRKIRAFRNREKGYSGIFGNTPYFCG